MRVVLIFILSFVSSSLIGQNQCFIKLVDYYSNESISISEVTNVNQKYSFLDSLNNLLVINRPRGKKLVIAAKNYLTFETDFRTDRKSDDTLVYSLKPIDSIAKIRFEEIFNLKNIPQDTLIFKSLSEVDPFLMTYLKYLTIPCVTCFNGMCNYSNTYKYWICFYTTDSIYSVGSITKIQPRSYGCPKLDRSLELLYLILPKFKLEEEQEPEFGLNFLLGPF